MIRSEHLKKATTELQPLPIGGELEDFEGMDKIVRKMYDGQHIVAAKIFREYQVEEIGKPGYKKINKPKEARKEMLAYKKLRETPLGIYVPEPYYLLQDETDQTVGLAIEWIEGDSLSRVLTEKPDQLLSSAELENLKQRVADTNALRVFTGPEMFAAWNIIIKPNSRQRIFLAECELEVNDSQVRYQGTILEDLERDYVLVK